MPIKPENKALYPENWKEIRASILLRANNCCEKCGIQNHKVIMRLANGKYRLPCQSDWDMIHSRIKHSHSNMTESLKHHGFIKIILTIAHLDHDPTNNNQKNLKALCQKCHNNYDKEHRRHTRKKTTGQIKLEL